MSTHRFKSRLFDHVIGLALAAAYLAALIATAKDVGFSRDEGFYFTAAKLYQGWFDVLRDDPDRALGEQEISRRWSYNHEHPALMKVLFGFSNRLFSKNLSVLSPATAYRLPGMAAAALLIYLIYLWGSFIFGRPAGLFAALAFALMPRVFYHSHLACFDVPITAAWFLVTYLYWRSLSTWKFGLAAGAAYGVALCVKLNAFFIPLALGFHYFAVLVYWLFTRKKQSGSKDGVRAPKPWAFIFGIVLAPPIFFGHWPWLWHDTLARLNNYLGFHSSHVHYNTAWFGENIIQAPTPIAFPAVMTLFTIPAVIIVLCLFGSLTRLRHHLPAAVDHKLQSSWVETGPRSSNGLDLLLLISLVFPIALISLPFVPVFGGTKHWMPAFPFIAILGGVAAARLAHLVSNLLNRLPAVAISASVIVFLLLPPFQQTAASHPFGLASYVPLIGGAPGAASLGMTRQFWGYTTAGVLPWLNANVPKSGRVEFHDTVAPAVKMYQEEGTLRSDIRMGNLKNSSFALMHHELHMVRNEAWIWNGFGTFVPAYVLTYQGVPIVSIYQRPNTKRPD
jgi:4-amino-4-deoxy-L-arabinose transferase-like glycosyltransferase